VQINVIRNAFYCHSYCGRILSFFLWCVCISLVCVTTCVHRAERTFYNTVIVKWVVMLSKRWYFEVNFTAAMLETDSALKVMRRRQQAYAVWPTVKSVCSILGVRRCCIRQVGIVRLQCEQRTAYFIQIAAGSSEISGRSADCKRWGKTEARVAWAYHIVQFTAIMQVTAHVRKYIVHEFSFWVKKLNVSSEYSLKAFIWKYSCTHSWRRL